MPNIAVLTGCRRNFGLMNRGLTNARPCVLRAVIALTMATLASAQDSQFLFDLNGNLQIQTGASSTPPQILGQPQNQVAAPGTSASFSVVSAQTGNLSYQWRFNGLDIP